MFQKPFRTTRRKLLNPHTQESTDGAFRNQMILEGRADSEVRNEHAEGSENERRRTKLLEAAGNSCSHAAASPIKAYNPSTPDCKGKSKWRRATSSRKMDLVFIANL